MKISYNWLREYIDLKKSPEEIAGILTNTGSEVKAIDKIAGDHIMDIEITPNRSDCLSYIGIAREISASIGRPVKMPPLKAKGMPGKAPFTVEIKDKDLCPRYTARLIKDVRVAESPEWLKKKVISMGLRPVNNVVDITNYVLFELGQPMHAFDYDKIKGKAVLIRRGCKEEKMTSIDNIARQLGENMLIIADEERPIAIGGVMGGIGTEVTESTKNVLLESAYFNPVSVRRTSFKLALISESSYRFERGVDPAMILPASDRAALLIKELCGGKIAELVDKGSKGGKKKKALLRIERLNRILNLSLKEAYVTKALKGLSLKVSTSRKGTLEISIPSFREDIKCEVDLIEEVARIYGYDNIDMTVPKIISAPERKATAWRTKEKAAEILSSLGLNEVVTYGLLRRGAIDSIFGDIDSVIAVKNPLSAEQEMMRPSLVPGVLNALNYNVNRGIKDLKLFEIGDIYYKSPEGRHKERTSLCIAVTGFSSKDWQREKGNMTFFDLKAILEILLRRLTLKDFTMAGKDVNFLAEGASVDVLYDGKSIGFAGCLAPRLQQDFDLSQEIYLAEIDLDTLLPHINFKKSFREIPKYPSIKRDVSLVASNDVSFGEITSVVREQGGPIIENIELFDRYSGKQIPPGRQGLAFRIEYRDPNKTLTSGGIDKVHNTIRESLVEKLGVTLR